MNVSILLLNKFYADKGCYIKWLKNNYWNTWNYVSNLFKGDEQSRENRKINIVEVNELLKKVKRV